MFVQCPSLGVNPGMPGGYCMDCWKLARKDSKPSGCIPVFFYFFERNLTPVVLSLNHMQSWTSSPEHTLHSLLETEVQNLRCSQLNKLCIHTADPASSREALQAILYHTNYFRGKTNGGRGNDIPEMLS